MKQKTWYIALKLSKGYNMLEFKVEEYTTNKEIK